MFPEIEKMNGDEYNRIRTVRRAFTLTKIAFAGGNGTWRLISEIGSDDNESTYSTHKTDGTSDNVRKSLNDLDDWFEAAYQFVISILIFFKRMSFFLKQLENSVGGVTGSECVEDISRLMTGRLWLLLARVRPVVG